MIRHDGSAYSLALAAVIYCLNSLWVGPTCDAFSLVPKVQTKFYAGPGVLPGEILRARGYLAKDFHIQSGDGYTLRITRGRNPLINGGKGSEPGRVPILFIHGIWNSYNVWVVNSFDAKPSVLTNISFTDTPIEQLNAQLGDLPSAKSLPLLAMDCGHEVFIMSRRGFPGSQKLQGHLRQGVAGDEKKIKGFGPVTAFLGTIMNYTAFFKQIPFSFDRDFWDFSLDQQARYDVPRAVDFVREQTGWDQISLVGHSAGGAITMAAMTKQPELNKKLSSLILWATGLTLGQGSNFDLLMPLEPILRRFKIAYPPAFATSPFQALSGLVCATKLAQTTLCAAVQDFVFGDSGGQAPTRPEFINTILYAGSSNEFAQAMQMVRLGGKMHTFTDNLETKKAEPYDLGRITNRRMSFWVGTTDLTVLARHVEATLPHLRVPYRFHLINTTFNHYGFFFHNNNSRLAIIPTLKEIYELSKLP